MRTRVWMLGLLVGLSPVQGQEPKPPASGAIVALDSEEPELSDQKAHGGLLIREIVRQAILIAGRDGLGLSTRDRVLGEAFPEEAKVLTARTLAIPGTSVRIRIGLKGDAPDAKPLGEHTIPLPPGDAMDYAALARGAEALSRGGFIETLKAAGLKGTPNAKAERGPVSDALERRLMILTFTEQFAALRTLHAAARAEGEAPMRLAAIVRGYAHLGKMTEGHMNASHKAFKARALLYAERAGAFWPGTRHSLWIRAYARAFAGLHGAALEDIAAAAKIPDDSGGVVPVWVPWIDAFCRYDAPALEAAEAPHNRTLLQFLRYLTFERCVNSTFERRQLLPAIQANPECYRLYETLCDTGGISVLHDATLAGPRMLAQTLYARLEDTRGLPPSVRKILDERNQGLPEPEARARVWQALIHAPDRGDPSWGTLGRMIQEATFNHLWRRGDFLRFKLSVDVGDFLEEARPLAKGHPYAALIGSYGLNRERQLQDWEALFSEVSVVDADYSARPVIYATWRLNPKDRILGKKAWELVERHRDDIAKDFEDSLYGSAEKDKAVRRRAALALLAVSPHSPRAIREIINLDWDLAGPKAAGWEKELSHHPQVLNALGLKYKELKRDEDAERCLKKTVALAPSRAACGALAHLYRERGDLDRWKQVLDDFLQTEDAGLDHASVRAEIARHYMSLKEWEKAQPYAEEAAQTWASWAMACARDCYEGMGNLPAAHTWQQRISERYEAQGTEWYLWVKRTGFGDEEIAEALALKSLSSRPGKAKPDDHFDLGLIHQLAGRPRDALKAYQEALKIEGRAYEALHVALLAMELGDTNVRDQALQVGMAYKPDKSKDAGREQELIRSIREVLSAGDAAKVDLKGWEEIVSRQDSIGKSNLPYFMGRFLELRDRKEDAVKFYRLSVASEQKSRYNVILSSCALRRLK